MALSFPSSSSSSSCCTSQIKCDVFLSFRGEDTCYNFTSHLHRALLNKQIDTFIDNELRKGDEISPSLLQAIKGSQISIIIFSRNYANSIWCLEELVKILECKNREINNQIVIPVFYGVDPSDVRHQTGSYANAFSEHEQIFKDNLDKVQTWKNALNVAANLSGWHSSTNKLESVLIEDIIKDVLKRLSALPTNDGNKNLVGIDPSIKQIASFLGTKDVHSIGIWGIGGIGKTTLAQVVFNKISYKFESSSFVSNVREASEQSYGLKHLQRGLVSTLLGVKIENIGVSYESSFIKRKLGQKKLLIVFDDVTNFSQIESLIGSIDCLSAESQIIITSRNKQVLKNCKVDQIYEVPELFFDDAIKLFSLYACRQKCPTTDFEDLTKMVVKYVGGVPLALKVLGSSLQDKRVEVWESAIKKLKNIIDKDIHKVLKISYDGLDDLEQRIFLDIACFFKWKDFNLVKAFLDACGFFAESGISALIDKSLITISRNLLTMHDLVEAMGKEIVRQESIHDPSKRSRLWDCKDIIDVLTKATGTKKVEGISLDISKTRNIRLHPRALLRMHNLRFLQFYISDYQDNNNKLHVSQDLKFLSTELRYFQWDRCPLKSLRSNFDLKNLVKLRMRDSNIKKLWRGVQHFVHLEEIDLTGSTNLIRFPDLYAPKLKGLILDTCTSLIKIPSSFQHLTQLCYLSLPNCKNLRSVPQLPISLESLNLDTCGSLIEMPSSFQHLSRLMDLSLSKCKRLKSIPQLPKSLQLLNLYSCSRLQRLPELSNNLEDLILRGCSSLVEIPSSIQHLTRLNSLDLSDCISLTNIPDCTGLISLGHLHLFCCSKLKRLPEIPNNFEQLDFSGCTSLLEIPSSFKHLNKLRSLTFSGCESLTSIPNLMGLQSLTMLAIERCSKLKVLPEFPSSIQVLYLKKIGIEELPPSCEDLCTLLELYLIDCSRLKSLPGSVCKWNSLQRLNLHNCPNIGKLPHPVACLKSLVVLSISRSVPPSIDLLHHLSHLCLSSCGITEIPDSVGCLTSLETLYLDKNNFEKIPKSIINLSNLQFLNISYCERLKVLPKLPWAYIDALNCTSLQELSCLSFPNDFFSPTSRFMLAKFVNCFKLDQNSLDSFVKNTQWEIQSQLASYRQVYERNEPPFAICYPGNEIMEWFNFQSSGSFIDVNLPLDWINYNFLCFALCVVVSFHDQCDDHCKNPLFIKYKCKVKFKKGGHKWNRMCGVLHRSLNSADYNKRSSHVIIGFGFNFFRELHDNEFTLQFYTSNWFGLNIKHCKVEKCGVHLISAKHIGESDKSEKVNELYSEESNEEDEPYLEEFNEDDKPPSKRLKRFNASNGCN